MDVTDVNAIQNEVVFEIERINRNVDRRFDSVKDEIQLRIHSYKHKLDELERDYMQTLDKTRENIKEVFRNGLTVLDQSTDMDSLVDELMNDFDKMPVPVSGQPNTATQSQLQVKHNQLKDYLYALRTHNLNIVFYENKKFDMDLDSIGPVYTILNFSRDFKLNFNVDYIELNACVYAREIVVMNGSEYLAIIGQNGIFVLFYTDSFKPIKCVKTECYELISMTYYGSYFYVAHQSGFIKRDTRFDVSEYYKYPSNVSNPSYIYAYDDKLYLCANGSVMVFTMSFDFMKEYRLKDCQKIHKLCILNDIACVSCGLSDHTICIRFYMLSDFTLKSQCNFDTQAITVFNNRFYLYDNRHIICLNSNAEIMTMKELEIGVALAMTPIDNCLYVCLQGKKKIAVLKF